MINNSKISLNQLCIILITIIPSTSLLFMSTSIYKTTKQDYWLSILIIGLIMIIYSIIFTDLVKMYPKKNFIEVCKTVLGTVSGVLLGIIYLIFFMHTTSSILREFSFFLNETLYYETPASFFAIGILIPCVYLVYKDIEIIGRIGEFIFFVFIITILIIVILSITSMDINRLLPILTQSTTSIIKGSVSLSIWGGQLFILLMVSCKVKEKNNITKSIIISISILIGIILIITTTVILVFGSNTEFLSFPFLSLARYVSMENILQRMDTIILIVWISSIFLKLSVYIYCGTQIALSIKKIKNKIIYIISIAIVIILLSQILWNNSMEFKSKLEPQSPIYAIIQVVIPIIIFVIAKLKTLYLNKNNR